jgi:hypothetical protein
MRMMVLRTEESGNDAGREALFELICHVSVPAALRSPEEL